jgi:hypothetical protein
MGNEKATKFWEYFEKLPKEAQADYMNKRFGDILFDISKDWEEYETEYQELDKLKQKYTYKKMSEEKSFVNEKDKEQYLYMCKQIFVIAENFNREEYQTEALLLKNIFSEIVEDLNDDDLQELYATMNDEAL